MYSWKPTDQITSESVIPVQTGIQGYEASQWIPAFAGMTRKVDQRVDRDNDGEIEVGETAWRHVEVNSHRPGALGAQLGIRAHFHANGQSTSP